MQNSIAPAHDPLTVEQPTDRTPHTARAYVAYVLGELGIPAAVVGDVTERALVIASELTTNVYAHTDGALQLDVALTDDCGAVVIEVTDHGAGAPELGLPSADLLAEHGYGLYLTSVLADEVYSYLVADGKVIGAVIRLPEPAEALTDWERELLAAPVVEADLSVSYVDLADDGFDTAFVIHDLDGTDSGACASDCSGCAIELRGGAR